MNAAEATYLNKHIKRLKKYGIDAFVQPDDNNYNIRFKDTKEIIEPYCSPTEVLGIINALEVVLERKKYYEDKRNYMVNHDMVSCYPK